MKKVIITMKHKKNTLEIRDIIKSHIEEAFHEEVKVAKCAKEIFDKIYTYKKKERKEAMRLVLEELYEDRKKLYDYAEEVIQELKSVLKEFDKSNKDAVKYILKQHEKATKAVEANKGVEIPHPFGTGFTRIKNEIRHRPSLIMTALKTKMSMM